MSRSQSVKSTTQSHYAWFFGTRGGRRNLEESSLVEGASRQSNEPINDPYASTNADVDVVMLDLDNPDPRPAAVAAAEAKKNKKATDVKVDDSAPDDAAYAFAIPKDISDEQEEDPAQAAMTAAEKERQRKRERKKAARMARTMDINFVIKTLENKVEEQRLTNELFIYLPFLVAFIFLFMTGAGTEQAYWARAQVGGQLMTGQFPTMASYGNAWQPVGLQPDQYHVSSSLMEVRNAQDWHFWLQSTVVDYLWDLPDPAEIKIANGFVQGGNMKFGAMRIRTLRLRDDSCTYSTKTTWNYSNTLNGAGGGILRDNNGGKCYGKFDAKKLNETSFGPPQRPHLMRWVDCRVASKQMLFGIVADYPCVGNAVEIPMMVSNNEAHTTVDSLRGPISGGLNYWSDQDIESGLGTDDLFHPFATRAVVLEFFTYLPFIDAFQAFKVLTEVTAGGRFVHFVQVNTFQIWSLNRAVDYVNTIYFFVFYIFVFYYVMKFINTFIAHMRRNRVFEFVTEFWNFWDLINLLCFLAVCVCRLAWIRSSILVHDAQLLATTSYDDQLDFISLLFNLQLYFNAVNTVISFLKILKYMELNPTLNIVTRTLASAQQSLVGVLVIFVIVILAYGVTGVAVFSNGMEDFRDLGTAMSTLMRMLIGDFDYIALRDENRFIAPLFFWSFMILGLFLILNFLIGIILEAFEDESDTTRAEPIPVLIRRYFSRVKTTLTEFFESPKAFMTRRRERRAHQYAYRSRMATIIDQLRQYQLVKIADAMSIAELEEMSDVELERQMPEESINRHDFTRIFTTVDPEHGYDRVEWVSAKYLDIVWEDCVRNFHVHRLGDAEEEYDALQTALQEASEDALRYVIGIGNGRGNDAARSELVLETEDEVQPKDPSFVGKQDMTKKAAYNADERRRREAASVQQLFNPTDATLENVKAISKNLEVAHRDAVAILRAMLRGAPLATGEVVADQPDEPREYDKPVEPEEDVIDEVASEAASLASRAATAMASIAESAAGSVRTARTEL